MEKRAEYSSPAMAIFVTQDDVILLSGPTDNFGKFIWDTEDGFND